MQVGDHVSGLTPFMGPKDRSSGADKAASPQGDAARENVVAEARDAFRMNVLVYAEEGGLYSDGARGIAKVIPWVDITKVEARLGTTLKQTLEDEAAKVDTAVRQLKQKR